MSDIFKQSTNKVKLSTKLQQSSVVSTGLRTTPIFFTKSTHINIETQKVNFSPKITETTRTILTSTSKSINKNFIPTTQANTIKQSIEINSERSPIFISKPPSNNIVPSSRARTTSKFTSTYLPESEYSPTKVSLFTLTALLGVIYGLAFILAVVWIVWLYVKRKSRLSLKRSQVDSREFCSINSVS